MDKEQTTIEEKQEPPINYSSGASIRVADIEISSANENLEFMLNVLKAILQDPDCRSYLDITKSKKELRGLTYLG